jgi:zinc and cadmium transporter
MLNLDISVITWIIGASILGGVLSVLCAGFLALNARTQWIPMLISYAIGAMLGAVFLEILPHAFHEASSIETMTATILFGILLFFVLEKLVLWRHCHGEHCEAHSMHTEAECTDHAHQVGASKFRTVSEKTPSISRHVHAHHHDSGRSGMMIMVGDTFHNFVDGILIAAAFMLDIRLGAVTAMAIIAHEIPQEVGDFLILLHSGYSKKQALLFNLFSSLATVIGGVFAYFALQTVQSWIPTILGLAAASMLYVAVADLIPGLHKRTELKATLGQVLLIGLGISSIFLTKFFLE